MKQHKLMNKEIVVMPLQRYKEKREKKPKQTKGN